MSESLDSPDFDTSKYVASVLMKSSLAEIKEEARRFDENALQIDQNLQEAVFEHYRELLQATSALQDLNDSCTSVISRLDQVISSLPTNDRTD